MNQLNTPAKVSGAVLDQIQANPENFDMGSWVFMADEGSYLRPEAPVTCGTTLCAAGWVGYVMGWSVSRSGSVSKDGGETWEDIVEACGEALGLDEADADYLFNTTEDEAIHTLKKIAGRV